MIAATGVSSASAAEAPSTAKLVTPNQAALLDSHSAVVTAKAPAGSKLGLKLYANGHAVSKTRKLVVRRNASSVRAALTLTGSGIERLRHCTTSKLEVRMAVHSGKQTTMVRDIRTLVLDKSLCATPSHAPAEQSPMTDPAPDETPAGQVNETPVTDPAPDQTPAADAPKSDKGLFKVGTAVVDISPDKPMTLGGYGSNYLVSNGVHDPLQVRAFFVGHGKQAVTFVSLDAQGWFASYQAPNAGDGAADARADAAAQLAARGYDVSAANVVVSATHDHAAPTIQGIWGHTDPAYLHRVKEAAVEAVLKAEQNSRDAELWSANGTIKGLVSQVQGTDQMAGFAVDADLPILWARDPQTGATLATYVNVPTHVDQYNPINSPEHQFSADYPGWVRDRLADTLGGTSVIAAGTLGRQESIGADSSYDEVAQQGRFITSQIMRALTHAHRITDTTLAANTQSFTTPAQNTGLLAAMSCNHGFAAYGCTEPAANNGEGTYLWTGGSIFTINRSLSAPWFSAGSIGTSATVARVGDQVYATAPGEAFPEVTAAIQRTFADADGIRGAHIIDHAGDQLGYYWDQRAGVYPAAQLAQSDFAKFNVGSRLAQDNVVAVRDAGSALGLMTTSQNAYAEIDNPNAFSEPTIQFYSNRVETDNPTVSLYATAKKAQSKTSTSTSIGSTAATQNDNKVSWDFGDGTTDVQTISTRIDHTFPAPGAYRVQASVTDNLGKTYRWVQTVKIDSPLTAAVDQANTNGETVLTARPVGGQRFDVIAAHWTFSDGSTAEGTTATAPSGASDAKVSIVDGAGNTATTTVAIG